MINRTEIETLAKQFEIVPTNVEKDYVFGWILFGLFTLSDLKETIFLKGGNALRKGYFENTRFSSDLDFGIPHDISQEKLLEEFNQICDFIQERAGVIFLKDDNKIKEKFTASESPLPDLKVYEIRLYFKDFYGTSDHLKLKIAMDVTRYDRVMLPIQSVNLIHPYSDSAELTCIIRCMKLEEIIATKLKCLLQRQHAPDLFDYCYSINILGGQLNKAEVVEVFVRKTIFKKNPHVLKDILIKTPFDYFREYWVKTVVCAKNVFINVEDAIAVFLNDLESLFDIYPKSNYAISSYFGSELRVPIIEAGRKQTLLKIRYKGSERMVEPYALKYMERKDGEQKEYLYVYNCSGGSNPPGIRALIPENFESIEVTSQNFEPRALIELSKAGERPENPYLFDPNKPLKAPKRRSIFRQGRQSIKYSYQCSICGKKFSKTKMSSLLGLHKNKSGHRCGGRFGIYLGTRY